jgi:hypothetical protein
VIAWIVDHPDYAAMVVGALLYLARAIMPRYPDPDWPPWAITLWRIEQRLLFLPWDKWIGRPHMPGQVRPDYRVDVWGRSEAPTKKEGKRP